MKSAIFAQAGRDYIAPGFDCSEGLARLVGAGSGPRLSLVRALQGAGSGAGGCGPAVAFCAGSHALIHDLWIIDGEQILYAAAYCSRRFDVRRAAA
jgi:hypothetical protein